MHTRFKNAELQKLRRNLRLLFKSATFIAIVILFILFNIFHENDITSSDIDIINNRKLNEECAPIANPKYLVIFYCLGILWLFLGLAIVADEFFVPALDIIAEEWQLSPDVAGATLLAAGGSAPELFTNLSAVIQNSSSTGFGAIVGSAVFNMFFVVGVCAIVCPKPMVLTWWPITRDSLYYAFILVVLAVFFRDYNIIWYEALILFLLYLLYILIMVYNTQLQQLFAAYLSPLTQSLLDDDMMKSDVLESTELPVSINDNQEVEEEETYQGISLMPPEDKNLYSMFWYIVSLPQMLCFYATIVDTRLPGKSTWRYYTFFACLAYFGLISYFVIQWIEIVGATLGIPSVIMGLTFLAMGTSVPDMLSAIIVAKSGEADKAVSSTIGSNIFDVGVGLAVPWLLYCMIHADSPSVPVEASSLLLSIIELIVALALLVTTLYIRNWNLPPSSGWLFIWLYFIYVAVQLATEKDSFGDSC